MRKLFVVALSAAFLFGAAIAFARPGGKGGAGPAARGGAGARPQTGAPPRSGGVTDGVRSGSGGAKSNLKGTLENGALESVRRSGEGSLRDQLGISPDQLHDLSGQLQNRAQDWKAAAASGPQPFSPAWYAEHPQAWQYSHPHADAWAVATAAGVATWFGWATAPYGATSGTSAEGEADQTQAEDPAEEPSAEEAQALAKNGAAAPSDDSQWLPLGVYALAPQNQNETTLLVQLAVNKEGILRGNYYDLISNQGQAIQGAVDLKSQQSAFTVGKGQAVFSTTIGHLTNKSTPVSLVLDGDRTLQWKLVRLEQSKPATK